MPPSKRRAVAKRGQAAMRKKLEKAEQTTRQDRLIKEVEAWQTQRAVGGQTDVE